MFVKNGDIQPIMEVVSENDKINDSETKESLKRAARDAVEKAFEKVKKEVADYEEIAKKLG